LKVKSSERKNIPGSFRCEKYNYILNGGLTAHFPAQISGCKGAQGSGLKTQGGAVGPLCFTEGLRSDRTIIFVWHGFLVIKAGHCHRDF